MHLFNPTLGIAPGGWKLALPVLILAVVLGLLWTPYAAILPAILGAYVLYFFRDPRRKAPGIPNSICSPADGVVASILEVPCPDMAEGRATRVAIFLNVFNVHVQRTPLAGTVTRVDRRAGRCMNAMNEKCSEENEAVTIWLDTQIGPVGVRQLSGAIARRIVCWATEGTKLDKADRYGLIQFGSRVELFLPLSCTVKVVPGQKVVGAITCMAIAHEAETRKGKTMEDIRRLESVGAVTP